MPTTLLTPAHQGILEIIMWVAQLRIWREKSIVVAATAGINAFGASYYLNAFRKSGKDMVTKVIFVGGPDKAKLAAAILASPKIKVRQNEGDQIFYEHQATDTFHAQALDGSVFIVGPIVARGGVEYWTVASWAKANINRLARRISATRGASAKILGISAQEPDFFLQNTFWKLSNKEAEALYGAVQEGYYDFPRKKNLETMAQEKGVDESTLREELRKAEGKVLRAAVRQATAI
ncbi:MAG: helix-turn-helix domain-containing protein [Candidatus Micrarchaeota archaeon]